MQLFPGDRVVLRRPAPVNTFAGGVVLDAQQRRWRRRDSAGLEALPSSQPGGVAGSAGSVDRPGRSRGATRTWSGRAAGGSGYARWKLRSVVFSRAEAVMALPTNPATLVGPSHVDRSDRDGDHRARAAV